MYNEEGKSGMSQKMQNSQAVNAGETKAKRIAISATVAGVLLIVFLVIILIIQFAKIGVKNAERGRLQEEIDLYERLNEDTEKDLEFYKTEKGLRMLAVMNGYKNKSDTSGQ